ncbi:MAG: hypothetical protein K6A72_05525 [Lachnospiraceae bacterium]|nr:hypothetical protein [Lachnospiraceae bacterium]
MEVKENKNKRKHLGIPLVILISIAVSLILNGSYLGLETACIKSGRNMPIQRELWGGDCIEYVGLYWTRVILTPATSVDDPAPPARDEQYFYMRSFILYTVMLACGLWIILSLVNRHFKAVLIVVGSVLFIWGGFNLWKKLKKMSDETPVRLHNMTIVTSDLHPGVYNKMWYPHCASYLVPADKDNRYGYSAYEYMDDYIAPEEIEGADLMRIINTAKAVKENTNTDRKDDFAYYVKIVYETRGGHDSIRIDGYGSFPEEWDEFIKTVNETCGVDYLREDPELQKYSDEWFSETYGIYDSDLPEGMNVEQFVTNYKIDMKRISGLSTSGDYWDFVPEKILENIADSGN